MGIFDFFKRRHSQEDIDLAKTQQKNMKRTLSNNDNRVALQKLIDKCPMYFLELLGKIKAGKGLTDVENKMLIDTMQSNPEFYRELWVRWTGNIELATAEEKEKWFGNKSLS